MQGRSLAGDSDGLGSSQRKGQDPYGWEPGRLEVTSDDHASSSMCATCGAKLAGSDAPTSETRARCLACAGKSTEFVDANTKEC